MSKFKIYGDQKLEGEIRISGAKNSALKLIPAAILADSPSIINNIPDISDIHRLIDISKSIGTNIVFEKNKININPIGINSTKPDEKLIKKLRGSIVIIGPLLAKFGHAIFSEPGGCLIGSRPIDDHLDVFSQLGVKIEKKDNFYHLTGKPKAGHIVLNKISVTATENAIMASVFSPGVTKISVAAAEPEIADLANYLNKMGADIKGAGTHDIVINGVKKLEGTEYNVIPDRIESLTYLIAGIATNSKLKIGPVISDHMNLVIKKLKMAGANIEIRKENDKEYLFTKPYESLIAQNIDTRTYPGFPTDIQSPYAVLMTQALGECEIFETLFEGRFLYIDELKLMGANIEVLSPHIITIKGKTRLKGTNIYSRDIRGGAALVIAGLIASGTTTISNVEFIDRGYEKMDQKLNSVGAKIERIEE